MGYLTWVGLFCAAVQAAKLRQLIAMSAWDDGCFNKSFEKLPERQDWTTLVTLPYSYLKLE